MPGIDNQQPYWDEVAASKTFTHPTDQALLNTWFRKDFKLLDYGCGYGRIVNEFTLNGFTNITGVDTSGALIERGKKLFPQASLLHIKEVVDLDHFTNDFDAVLLFAVLTCIPSNKGQKQLMDRLFARLKKGGLLYISDYYLQPNSSEVKAYSSLNNDADNYGVFSLPEGAVFRHHTKEWIRELLQPFEMLSEKPVPVKTMNGHVAEAFQVLVRK